MLRRLLIAVLIFLIVLVIAVDRVGAIVAAHVLAGKVQTDEHLTNRPSVSIKGIPFLTQAFGGRYSDVHLSDHDVVVSGVPVTTLTVDLHGLHLPFGKAIRGSVSQVPVDRVSGTAFVSFSDANSYLSRHLPAGTRVRIAPGPDDRSVAVVDRVQLAGQHFVLRGSGAISVSGNVVAVDVSRLAPTGAAVAPGLVARALAKAGVSFPLQAIPFKLQLTSVRVSAAGLSGAGESTSVVLGSDQQ